ncbi:hypothetical protein [Streptomyces sp. NPDC056061]|uniref:hypothetical protein n=1 Tax=Streptomyces sp. NPDC056061 TaxID=3345700 RepID=UPI0035D67BC5
MMSSRREVDVRPTDGDPVPLSVSPESMPALELKDLAHEDEPLLIARGAAYAREYVRIQGNQTTLLKNLAVVIVSLRVRRGELRGTSHEYRQIVAGMYRQAGIGPAGSDSLQTAVRWHVGNLLRRVATPRELERADLKPTSPLERQQDSRAVTAKLAKAARVTRDVNAAPKGKRKANTADAGQAVKATADHLRLAQVAGEMLTQLDRHVITKDMTDGQRQALDKQLAAMERKLATLRKLTAPPTKD